MKEAPADTQKLGRKHAAAPLIENHPETAI
jgi:hypothetical protein